MRRRTRDALLLTVLIASAACSAQAPESSSTVAANSEAAPRVEAEIEALPSVSAPPPQPPSEPEDQHVISKPLGAHLRKRYPASLEQVIEKRFLRVLTSRNAFDFFIDRGQRGGYQYEKVKAFTRFLNRKYLPGKNELQIQFELIPVDDDQLIPMLVEGRADLVAARMTITPERSSRLLFSRPYRTVDELIVTRESLPPLESVEALSGKTVAVRLSSSYHDSLIGLNERLEDEGLSPVGIELVDEELETERILELVAAERFDYTVADSMVAELAVEIHPNLTIAEGLALRRNGKLSWATLPGAAQLAEQMNAFLARHREGSVLDNLALRKYFAKKGALVERFGKGTPPRLSEFDDLFRRHAARFDIDWRLAAAMAHQESRFDADALNRWGATGLMQIKPKTAREPYIDIPEIAGVGNVDNNVKAGLKYLMWIKARYFDPIPDMRERDRLRMALAAYNAGPRTIARARNRARKMGLDPNRWFRNVEVAQLEGGRAEPVKYVSEINQRYLAYILLGIE